MSFAILLSQIKSLYLAFIGRENFNFSSNFILLIVTIVLTIFLGRFFCGFICSFGAVTEWINLFSRKLFKIRFEMPKKLDRILKGLKYIVLIYLVGYIWTFDKKQYVDPWDAFDNIISLNFNVSFYVASFAFLAGIFVLSIFVSRPYCRYFCPLGAIFALFSKAKIASVKKKDKNCGQCRICEEACPMGIDTENAEKYKGECISCIKCVEICPRYNMQLNLANQPVNPRYTSSLTVAGLFAVFSALSFLPAAKKVDTPKTSTITSSVVTENYQTEKTTENINSSENNQANVEQKYQAETNKDSSQQTIEAQVQEENNTQKDSASSKVQQNQKSSVSSDNLEVKQKIDSTRSQSSDKATQKSQATDIEESKKTVQNYSYSSQPSNSTDKTSEADLQQENPSAAAETNTQSSENSNTITQSSNAKSRIYKDGTYTGEGFGYRPGLVVEVTIKDDRITKIEIVSNNETPGFARLPFEIIPQEIIESQSTDVDVVSGATRTSYGIIMAVEDALNKAKIENSSGSQN